MSWRIRRSSQLTETKLKDRIEENRVPPALLLEARGGTRVGWVGKLRNDAKKCSVFNEPIKKPDEENQELERAGR